MPKLEPKQVQKELESGYLWPVYWIYGHERMKARELLKRIRAAALGVESGTTDVFGAQTLDGGEVSAATIVDEAQSLSLGGGLRFVVVRDAHAIKEAETLSRLLGERGKKGDLASVCVFLSKDLDGRKKFSKLLLEKAAVVPCEEVAEADREAWIQYLAKRKGVALTPDHVVGLRSLDPWTLDIIEQELEKYSLAMLEGAGASDVFLEGSGRTGGAEEFLEAFFSRNLKAALVLVGPIAQSPEESLPLLGLLGWNVRHLALVIENPRGVKMSPYLLEKFRRWTPSWTLDEILALQEALAELDFSVKQTRLLPLGLWAGLVERFCR